jgi:hypothetical protein
VRQPLQQGSATARLLALEVTHRYLDGVVQAPENDPHRATLVL